MLAKVRADGWMYRAKYIFWRIPAPLRRDTLLHFLLFYGVAPAAGQYEAGRPAGQDKAVRRRSRPPQRPVARD